MIVLDTNVISDVLSRQRSPEVLGWLNAQDAIALFIPTIVFAELFFGAYLVTDRQRREALLHGIGRIRDEYQGRILMFGDFAAERYGRMTAMRRMAGRPTPSRMLRLRRWLRQRWEPHSGAVLHLRG